MQKDVERALGGSGISGDLRVSRKASRYTCNTEMDDEKIP